MDAIRKKFPNHTELAYREAVSKLKYFLAESYAPRVITSKPLLLGRKSYRDNIEEFTEETDAQSVISDASKREPSTRTKYFNPRLAQLPTTTLTLSAPNYPSNNDKPASSAPPPTELLSFIERQEEYIEQLERESQYCKDELKGLIEKVKEVVVENEALQEKYKSGLMKSVMEGGWPSAGPGAEDEEPSRVPVSARRTVSKPLEGPSIVFESRIAELEAQLTQARMELRKAREESQAHLARLTEARAEASSSQQQPGQLAELERASRERRELEARLAELERELGKRRAHDVEAEVRSKRASEIAQQAEYEKVQAEAEVRRLRDELERRQDKLREALQETNRRIAEEKMQVERRFSQQVEQLSADVASHWEAASKSHLESEKQRREIADLKRELAQRQAYIDDLKKEMQNKISKMQEELNEAIAQKDASQEEVANVRLSAERSERQGRQEQARFQAEINSYKMRLERADADLVHARRENLRLGEEIAALEKEINMNKLIGETRVVGSQPSSRADKAKEEKDKDKELASLIFDLENKQAKTVASLEETLNKQASLVSRLTAECQSLTQRLEANDQKHKKEMATLQDNIEYLSSKIGESLDLRTENTAGDLAKVVAAPEQTPSVQAKGNGDTNENYNLGTNPANGAVVEAIEGNVAAAAAYAGNEQEPGQKYPEQPNNYPEDYPSQHYSQYDQYDPSQYPEYFGEQQYTENQEYADNQQYDQAETYSAQDYKDYANQHEDK